MGGISITWEVCRGNMVCGGLVGPCTPWNIYHTLQLLIIVTFPPLIAYLLGRIRGRRSLR